MCAHCVWMCVYVCCVFLYALHVCIVGVCARLCIRVYACSCVCVSFRSVFKCVCCVALMCAYVACFDACFLMLRVIADSVLLMHALCCLC